MSSLAYTMSEQHNPSRLPLLLMALAFIAGVIAFSSGMSHAIERHGKDATMVSECLQRGGQIQLWFNPVTGRHAQICQVSPTLFGIRISKNNLKDDVTLFLKNKLRRIEQVEKYLTNGGYTRIR